MNGPRALRLAVALAAALLATPGCKNACEELTEVICERSGKDLDACRAAPPAPPADPKATATTKPADPCDKIRAVTATCESLRTEAAKATAEDKDACRADLELVRALDKQTM